MSFDGKNWECKAAFRFIQNLFFRENKEKVFWFHVKIREKKRLLINMKHSALFSRKSLLSFTKVTQEKALKYVLNTIKIHLRYNNFSFKGLFSAIVTQETTSLIPVQKKAKQELGQWRMSRKYLFSCSRRPKKGKNLQTAF